MPSSQPYLCLHALWGCSVAWRDWATFQNSPAAYYCSSSSTVFLLRSCWYNRRGSGHLSLGHLPVYTDTKLSFFSAPGAMCSCNRHLSVIGGHPPRLPFRLLSLLCPAGLLCQASAISWLCLAQHAGVGTWNPSCLQQCPLPHLCRGQ